MDIIDQFFDAFQISYNAIIRDQVDFQRIRYENFIKVLYHFCINQLQYSEELTKLKLTLEILNRLISSYNHIFLITKNDVSNIYQKIFVTYESVKKLVVIILVWLIQNGKTVSVLDSKSIRKPSQKLDFLSRRLQLTTKLNIVFLLLFLRVRFAAVKIINF